MTKGAKMEKPTSDLTFAALRAANIPRCEEGFGPLGRWSPLEWGGAAAGEMGELCNLLKKMRRGEVVDLQAVAHEIADVIIYLDLLSARIGINMGLAVVRKFN